MADFSKRTKSTQRNSSVTSGYMCDFTHVTGSAAKVQICPAGSVVTLTSINIAPGSGNVVLYCGNDIIFEASTARDYKQNFYAYAAIRIQLPDATADVTVYYSAPSKGMTSGI